MKCVILVVHTNNDHTIEVSTLVHNHQHHRFRANHQGLPRQDRQIAIALLRQSIGSYFKFQNRLRTELYYFLVVKVKTHMALHPEPNRPLTHQQIIAPIRMRPTSHDLMIRKFFFMNSFRNFFL